MTDISQLSLGGVDVSRETFDALKAYEALVQRWTPAINLVSKSTVSNVWHRHIVDSAQIFSVCPASAEKWVDLGSGGGFPGIVVAILAKELSPRLRVTLVESDLRKATFLRQAAQTLGLQATVVSKRIESLEPMSADVLSARALAPLPTLLGYAATHLAESGTAILPKGARYQDEIADARKAWSFDVDIKPSLSEAEAAILVIRNIQSVQH
jgi:16S rRNA (guanine527-N7)-methyltransferase